MPKINAGMCSTSNPGKKYITDVAIDDDKKKKYKTKQINNKNVQHKVSRK